MVIPFLVSAGRVDFATSEGHMAIGDVSREGVVDSARPCAFGLFRRGIRLRGLASSPFVGIRPSAVSQ